MRVGIDLGTTFSCIAYVDSDGHPRVIPNDKGEETTASIVAIEGRRARVGASAAAMKTWAPNQVKEYVKRDIGKPIELDASASTSPEDLQLECAPYEVGGFKYGAAGISALILRRLKLDALDFLRRAGEIPPESSESDIPVEAVITVPAYFGEHERKETRLAGFAAGLDVIGIINEPTAAALAYGLVSSRRQRALVFDLGGGTFDATLLEIEGGTPTVLASLGDKRLGGMDWDEVIDSYLRSAFCEATGVELPDDVQTDFEVRSKAIAAKLALSSSESTTVEIEANGRKTTLTLFRSAPEEALLSMDSRFYFEEGSSDLVLRARRLCEHVVQSRVLPTPGGSERPMSWNDIDETVLTGGGSRMPMIPAMLKDVTGRPIRPVAGFNMDTAVALGAALYAQNQDSVRDVLSHTVSVEVVRNGRLYADPLILKDTPLPCSGSRRYEAGSRVSLRVVEGESTSRDECRSLGSVDLDTKDCQVDVHFEADLNGTLSITAYYPPAQQRTLELRHDLFEYGTRAEVLRKKIQSISFES